MNILPHEDPATNPRTPDEHRVLALWFEWLFGPVPEVAARALREMGFELDG